MTMMLCYPLLFTPEHLSFEKKNRTVTVIKNDELGRIWKKANTICLEGVINITTNFTHNSEPLAL
jgi:hypothetical protein